MNKLDDEVYNRAEMNAAFINSSMCYCYNKNCGDKHAAVESQRLNRNIQPIPISIVWVHEILGNIQDRPKCPYCDKTMVIG